MATKIIKNTMVDPAEMTCKCCKSIFTYNFQDIQRKEESWLLGMSTITRRYITCPVCKYDNDADLVVKEAITFDNSKTITFDKNGYADRIDLPWLSMSAYPPEDGEWGFFTDGKLEAVGRWKHDAMDHLYPFYGPEKFDHSNITHWCPLGKLPEESTKER